jgi:mycofactocin precursor
MADTGTPTLATPADAPATDLGPGPEDDLLEEDLLVEEISIDGMCGVY